MLVAPADRKACLYSEADALLTEAVDVDVSEGSDFESENYRVFVEVLDGGAGATAPAAAMRWMRRSVRSLPAWRRALTSSCRRRSGCYC